MNQILYEHMWKKYLSKWNVGFRRYSKTKMQFRARKNARANFSKLNTIWNDNRHTGSEEFHSKIDVCIIIYLEFTLQIEYIL